MPLADDDLQVSVNMRGGPEKWQVTGWLQIMDVAEHHEGDYTCIAQNELGENRASARLKVTDRKGEEGWGWQRVGVRGGVRAPRGGLHVHRPERVGGEQGERPAEGHRP